MGRLVECGDVSLCDAVWCLARVHLPAARRLLLTPRARALRVPRTRQVTLRSGAVRSLSLPSPPDRPLPTCFLLVAVSRHLLVAVYPHTRPLLRYCLIPVAHTSPPLCSTPVQPPHPPLSASSTASALGVGLCRVAGAWEVLVVGMCRVIDCWWLAAAHVQVLPCPLPTNFRVSTTLPTLPCLPPPTTCRHHR